MCGHSILLSLVMVNPDTGGFILFSGASAISAAVCSNTKSKYPNLKLEKAESTQTLHKSRQLNPYLVTLS